ncbi:MAG: hypothetical protein N4A54_12345 [Peptostreptococcaceae bacterium]|jgi:hypothetical protein|nr:hypothetical protein [Peptostreptococcaceae bacterium]
MNNTRETKNFIALRKNLKEIKNFDFCTDVPSKRQFCVNENGMKNTMILNIQKDSTRNELLEMMPFVGMIDCLVFLDDTTHPLATRYVLEYMEVLSGTEFVVADNSGYDPGELYSVKEILNSNDYMGEIQKQLKKYPAEEKLRYFSVIESWIEWLISYKSNLKNIKKKLFFDFLKIYYSDDFSFFKNVMLVDNILEKNSKISNIFEIVETSDLLALLQLRRFIKNMPNKIIGNKKEQIESLIRNKEVSDLYTFIDEL